MKRRKVGNLLALAILTALVEKPMHPYEMATVLRQRGKDQDMAIKWGSLYRVVQNLTKHGLVEPVETGRQGARPERSVYRLTGAGRAEAVDWVRELVGTPEPEQLRFEAGLSVLGLLEPDDVADLLRRRVEALDDQLTKQREALDQDSHGLPRLFLLEREYDLTVREAELTWTRSLLAELTDGSFPDLDGWRAYHDRSTP